MKKLRFEEVSAAAQILVRYPGRSALTMLGLAIGVAAFIAMVSFGEGARRSVIAQFGMLGTNLLVVSPFSGQREALNRSVQPLTDSDIQSLRREATTLRDVIPVARLDQDVSHDGLHHWLRTTGTLPGFADLHSWTLVGGGMFDLTDVAQRAKVCVMGATPARLLFGDADPLGQTITVGGVLPCRVVGLLATKGYSAETISTT